VTFFVIIGEGKKRGKEKLRPHYVLDAKLKREGSGGRGKREGKKGRVSCTGVDGEVVLGKRRAYVPYLARASNLKGRERGGRKKKKGKETASFSSFPCEWKGKKKMKRASIHGDRDLQLGKEEGRRKKEKKRRKTQRLLLSTAMKQLRPFSGRARQRTLEKEKKKKRK